MARGLYTVSFPAEATDAAWQLFGLTCGERKSIMLHGLVIGQTTELGDTAEEQINYAIVRGDGSTAGGGSSITPAAVTQTDGAAVFTAIGPGTWMSGGTQTTLFRGTFNLRFGLQLWFAPEQRPMVGHNDRLAIGLASAPADSVTWVGTCYVEEF